MRTGSALSVPVLDWQLEVSRLSELALTVTGSNPVENAIPELVLLLPPCVAQ